MKLRTILLAISLLAASLSVVFPETLAVDFPVTSMARSDLIYTQNNHNYGSAVSESKISIDPAYQSGSAVYGPNNPIIYTGLMAEETSADQGGPSYLHSLKITIKIVDSSGNVLPPINVGNLGMNISPNDSPTATDWAHIFTELNNFLTSIGLPSIITLQNPASVNISGCASSSTGVGCDASSLWAQWTIPGPLAEYAKAINFRYQPNFPKPDVYTVNVSTEADLWTTQFPGHFLTSAMSSYSFQYVYESDANSGNDAGKTFSTATGISLGSYTGLLYGADTVDMYKFDATQGQTVYYNLVPPSSADFGVAFYDPSWNPGAAVDSGIGRTTYGSFTPSATGSWFEKIYITSGSGTYSFALSNTPIPPDFSTSVSPTSLCLYPGTSSSVALSLLSINGFSGNVGLSSSISPSNVYVWAYFRDTTKSTTTVSVSAGASTTSMFDVFSSSNFKSVGSYTITITGASGSLSHSTSVALKVDQFTCPFPPPGSGSVAAGTLITLADGTQVPVQNLRVGMQLLSYDLVSHQYVGTSIIRFYSVLTDNQMVIKTLTGKPLIVDQNPAQEVYVMTSGSGWMLMPVTELKVGYSLFDALSQTWTPITSIQYQNSGQHIMYDLYTTSPGNYIANGYLDPQKN